MHQLHYITTLSYQCRHPPQHHSWNSYAQTSLTTPFLKRTQPHTTLLGSTMWNHGSPNTLTTTSQHHSWTTHILHSFSSFRATASPSPPHRHRVATASPQHLHRISTAPPPRRHSAATASPPRRHSRRTNTHKFTRLFFDPLSGTTKVRKVTSHF